MPRDERTKADYQPWNHEHFMADKFVRRMRSTARKTYVMLLHEAFFCSTRPYLPDDDEELWLMADCDTREEWIEVKDEVRKMFTPLEINGVKLLAQRRVEEDWERILGKRGVVSEVRSRAAKLSWERRKQADANGTSCIQTDANVYEEMQTNTNAYNEMQTDANDAKRSKEKRSEVKLSEADQEDEQEDMKSEKLIAIHCQAILKTNADLSENNKLVLKALDTVHKGSVVARAFQDWAQEHKYDEIRRPVSAFLKVADDILSGERQSIVEVLENDVVKKAGREIAYMTDNQVALDTKHKAVLKAAVEEEDYTVEEVVQAFKTFYDNLDISRPGAVTYAAKNFAEEAADRLYAVRRKAAEKQREEAAVARAAEELSRKTQEDVQARLAALEREKQEADEELPE